MQSPATDATDRPRGRRFLTCGEAPSQLGVNRSKVTRLVQTGAFPLSGSGPRPEAGCAFPRTSLTRGCTPTQPTPPGAEPARGGPRRTPWPRPFAGSTRTPLAPATIAADARLLQLRQRLPVVR